GEAVGLTRLLSRRDLPLPGPRTDVAAHIVASGPRLALPRRRRGPVIRHDAAYVVRLRAGTAFAAGRRTAVAFKLESLRAALAPPDVGGRSGAVARTSESPTHRRSLVRALGPS